MSYAEELAHSLFVIEPDRIEESDGVTVYNWLVRTTHGEYVGSRMTEAQAVVLRNEAAAPIVRVIESSIDKCRQEAVASTWAIMRCAIIDVIGSGSEDAIEQRAMQLALDPDITPDVVFRRAVQKAHQVETDAASDAVAEAFRDNLLFGGGVPIPETTQSCRICSGEPIAPWPPSIVGGPTHHTCYPDEERITLEVKNIPCDICGLGISECRRAVEATNGVDISKRRFCTGMKNGR